jgi:putative endopeptidase
MKSLNKHRTLLSVSLLLSFALPVAGLDLDMRDSKVRPGDNFFNYALGAWDARTAIAADQSEAGVDVEVFDRVQSELREIIEHSAATSKDSEALIGALYGSFMDEARIEALDAAPLKHDLALIEASATKGRITDIMAASYAGYGASFFSLTVSPDAKHPNNALILGQGGLGMPDRDYYLESEFREQKAAYQSYVARALTMAGYAQPKSAARRIVDLETRMARISWSQTQSREVNATYNPKSVSELLAYAPGIPWRRFFDSAGAAGADRVIVAENTAVRGLAQLFASTPLETLKAWQIFHTVDGASAYLSSRFVQSRFAFRGTALSGMKEMRPRWKRGVALVNSSLGQALGRAYVARHFPAQAKEEMTALVGRLKAAMQARISLAIWMSPSTKREALDKLEHMKVFVGYPDAWRDYSGLRMQADDLYGNVARSMQLDWRNQIAKVGKPLDPLEWGPFDWGIQPQTVDAFNIALENKIIFPAAILQPPFFDLHADPAANYGSIGGIIGHEITHGFDDQGRKIDASGALRDWWAPADAARFAVEADKLVGQFDAYEVLPGVHLNGRQVLGENIADLGGLLLALDAYHAFLNGAQPPVIDGLTGDQRVFLGWASRWRRKLRDDAQRRQIAMDVHAPASFRVNGPIRNIDAWYAAFDIQPSDRLYLKPDDRARIW